MRKDKQKYDDAIQKLNSWVVNDLPDNKKFVYINTQGDLFDGFDLTPKCTINWDSPKQVIPLFKQLGFDLKTKDKAT
jgi:hypothetical protein